MFPNGLNQRSTAEGKVKDQQPLAQGIALVYVLDAPASCSWLHCFLFLAPSYSYRLQLPLAFLSPPFGRGRGCVFSYARRV